MSKMNYGLLCSVMNVLLIISTVVSIDDAQSGENSIEETETCEPVWPCWVPAVNNFIDNPRFPVNNSTVADLCSDFDEFKLCVDRNQSSCSFTSRRVITDTIKTIGNILCNDAGRSAVEDLETSQCLIDEEKKERVLDAIETCFDADYDNYNCSNDPTEEKQCLRVAIQSDCGENGARVFASVAWESVLGSLRAQICYMSPFLTFLLNNYVI
ncbi:uncharacterized protein LOC131953797 [Physella acuta]|uniref:uncharacterized protein LOC131953797 n=1 Tax=Physella acuta TaxID=109671 RepID=UPI0027DB6DE7|nr:uncharacterized protein LOC131953797 [Physella acuta]